MLSLKEYINELAQITQKDHTIFWVLGNESADADSVISSIIYAWFLTISTDKHHVPIINITRDKLRLRNKVASLLRLAQIDTAKLIFIDDISLHTIADDSVKNIILVDHNTPALSQKHIAKAVNHIVDHHDSKLELQVETQVINHVGSCATIIADILLTSQMDILDETIAMLLLAPILLDTVNLSEKAGRTFNLDIFIVNRLLEISKIDRHSFYTSLLAARNESKHLTFNDLLIMDYKEWQVVPVRYGISSIPVSIEECLTKDENFRNTVNQFFSNRGLDLLILMHTYTKRVFTREMTIFAKKPNLTVELIDWLNDNKIALKEKNVTIQETQCYFFKQGRVSDSRKKIQPLIEAFLSNQV